jgi:hypothetical protein
MSLGYFQLARRDYGFDAQVQRQIQAAEERKDRSIELDLKRTYVAVCQACESLASSADKVKEPMLTKFVQLVEKEGYTIPAQICRTITMAKAKTCLRTWSTSEGCSLLSAELQDWLAMSVPWVCDDQKMEPWDILNPQFRSLQPDTDEEDVLHFLNTWTGCFLNDTTNVMCKDDASLTTLDPLLKFCTFFLDARISQWPMATKFRKQADPRLLLAIENVTCVFRGLVGLISPVPMDRGVEPADVDFVFPQVAADIAVSRRRSGIAMPPCMADIGQAGKVMSGNIASSKAWRQLRNDFKAMQAVDQEYGPALVRVLLGLTKVEQPECTKEEADSALADALQTLPPMLSGPKKVRAGGAQPLVSRLHVLLEGIVDDCLGCEIMGPEDQLECISEYIALCSMVPGMEHVITKATAFKLAVQGQNTSAALTTLLSINIFDEKTAAKFLNALRASDTTQLTPAIGKQLLHGRVKLCRAVNIALDKLGSEATPNSIDVYMNCITEIHRVPVATEAAGGLANDRCTRAALDIVPFAILGMQVACAGLQSRVAAKLPVSDALTCVIGTHDKFRKVSLKYANGPGVEKLGVEAEVLTCIHQLLDVAPMMISNKACEFIQEHGRAELHQTAALLEKKAMEVSPIAGGHPSGDGKSWTQGLVGEKSAWTLDAALVHGEKTIEMTDHGPEIESAIPIMTQAFWMHPPLPRRPPPPPTPTRTRHTE